VLLGVRGLHDVRVGVGPRRGVEQHEAALLLEVGRLPEGRLLRLEVALRPGELLRDHADVLEVHVDLAARQRTVDDLGRAHVQLEHDLVPPRLERLLVEVAEDELLGEVLRAERDGRLAVTGEPLRGLLLRLAVAAARPAPGDSQRQHRGQQKTDGAVAGHRHRTAKGPRLGWPGPFANCLWLPSSPR
jgi:hypothetical protein